MTPNSIFAKDAFDKEVSKQCALVNAPAAVPIDDKGAIDWSVFGIYSLRPDVPENMDGAKWQFTHISAFNRFEALVVCVAKPLFPTRTHSGAAADERRPSRGEAVWAGVRRCPCKREGWVARVGATPASTPCRLVGSKAKQFLRAGLAERGRILLMSA